MRIRRLALLGLMGILAAVFYVGNTTVLLGPYSDTLHLIILSSTLFIALLAYLFVTIGRGRG